MKNRRLDKFTELYSPYLDEPSIHLLYESILSGLQDFPPPKKKSTGPEKPLKYRYPMIKGISVFPVKKTGKIGGRKTRKKNRRYKKYSKMNKKRYSKRYK